MKPEHQWTVQRWSQYKLGNAPMEHEKDADRKFDTESRAQTHADTADSGINGDMRYRYKIIPPAAAAG
jgi:hypothetical protein